MLKKFLIGTFAVAALAFAMSASAAYDFGTTALRVGSKGEAVKNVQIVVGATPADGVFGPMTAAKVKAWQASNGLTADGVFGNASKAKANETAGGSTCPAGQFDPATGKACGTSTLPAGCTATSLFSSTTGLSCTGGTTPDNGALVGGAGDINLTSTTTDVETQVTEGKSDVKVLGFKVEAMDSDVSLTNLKVTLKNLDSTSSYRLDRYASDVTVWMGSTKVGSADVSEFTKDGTTYSKSIALNNAIVREGVNKKATFYVALTGNSSIDSVNMSTDNWAILVNNVRFQDATGVVLTSNDTAGNTLFATSASGYLTDSTNFDFTSLALNGDVKVVVSKGSSNPVTKNVKVSDTATTKDVLMLEFKVKATGSDVSFDTLNLLSVENTSSSFANVVSELTLKNGSDILATLDGSTMTGTDTVTLDNTFTIAKDTTETFRVYATINDWDNFKTNGGSLKVIFNGFTPEDSNGDTIVDTGSANGEYQTFVLNAPIFSLVSKSMTSYQAIDGVTTGLEDIFLAKFVFNVTAGDDDIYLPTDTIVGGADTDFATFTHTATGNVDSVVVEPESTTLDDGNTSSYLVAAGSTEKFTMSIYVRANNQSEKFTITAFNYGTADDTAGAYTYGSAVSTGLSDFVTTSAYLAK